MRRLILRSHQSPGDVLMLTAAVRDLHAAHPGQFQTDVRTSAPDLWLHNPHLTPLNDADPSVETIEMHYPLVHQSNGRPYHFLHGYCQYLEDRLKLKIPLTAFQGDLHLRDEERESPPGHLGQLPERFWIVMGGGKFDFTAKWWNPESYQQVVDHFRDRIEFLQCGEADHWHPPLGGVTSLLGRTSIREFIRLMYFAEGVVCPVTFAMHLAAAVPVRPDGPRNRACIVISGGREPPHWEAYPQHQFFHTIGQLDCCATGGCWKSRCQIIGDGDDKDWRNRCDRPISVSDGLAIPQCMDLIRPREVIASIERTLEGWSMQRSRKPAVSTVQPVKDRASAIDRDRQDSPAVRPKRVLIEFRHGLGDAAQFTSVLRHLRHYHPDWEIDVASLRGKHSAFFGLCRHSLLLEELHREPGDYAETFRLDWDECRSADPRWPNTKVSRCLLEVFRLTPLPDLCQYSIQISETAQSRADDYLESLCGPPDPSGRYRAVLMHYEGNTSGPKKNLSHDVARAACETVRRLGFVPVILDWDFRSPLPDRQQIFCPDKSHELWGSTSTGDAEQLAALIAASRLMVGIDSGPLHVAGATETPTIGVWTRHHPIHFFDRGQHVVHLVPTDHEELVNGPPALRYFRQAYRHEVYGELLTDLPKAIELALASTPGPHIVESLPSVSTGESKPTSEPESVTQTGPLRSTAYNEDYYQEHKAAGLDYLGHGDWQRDYGRWLVDSLDWNGKRVLDVGCACGSILRGLLQAGADMCGCDLNEAMIVRGRAAWPELVDRLVVCDAANLHLWREGAFDGIHTAQVAEHWPPELVPRILQELARVTRPGGLMFCCLDTAELFARQGRDGSGEDPTHICIRSLAWWREQLTEAGWEVVTPETEPRLRRHPLSYLSRYDWDYVIARRSSRIITSHADAGRDPRTVSIIVAARNYAPYLAEALESAFSQSHPCEVIYVDDGSTDDSLEIARRYVERGLVVLEPAGHQGVCAARNRGAAVARGECLLFLDGDDRLPRDFVNRHLAALTPGTPFSYGPALSFGDGPRAGQLWDVPAWEDYDLWQTNTVNTSALYARWAFFGAGGWRGRFLTMWDWDLAIRASRLGTPRPSTATLEYRQHCQSWSASRREKTEADRASFLGEIRRANARLSVGAILSGRLPKLLDRWCASLVYSVRGIPLEHRPELVVLDNGRSLEFTEQVRRAVSPYLETFDSIRIVPLSATCQFADEASRQKAIADFMARSSIRLQEQLRGDVVWLIEDDILVPLTAGRELWNALTDGWHPPAATAGCYRSRHAPDRYVGGWWNEVEPTYLTSVPEDGRPFDVDFTGTGCLMYWRHHSPQTWESHCRGVPAHDWAWCEAVRNRGRRVLMHPKVRCDHARSEEDVLSG